MEGANKAAEEASASGVATCFGPFRPVGVVCGGVTAAATQLYGEPMLLVPIGRTFQLYKGEQMHLVRGGPEYESEITCAAQAGKLRYVAHGATLQAMNHHKPLWSKKHNAVLGSPVTVLVAVDDLVFSIGEDCRCVISGGKTGEEVTAFSLGLPPGVLATTAVVPPHFKNKLLVGCSDGALRLYNFVSGKLLFTWRVPAGRDGAMNDDDAPPQITALAASAFRGIVAVGTSDARAIVYHFEKDAVLASFVHDSARGKASAEDDSTLAAKKRHRRSAVVDRLRPNAAGDGGPPAITAIAFRTDDEGRTLATGNALGEIAFWDLSERKLAGTVSGSKQVTAFDELVSSPHRDAVHTLYFVPGRPLLVTCGADNSLIEFRLDTVDGLALAIRERRGHTGRCLVAQFYNKDLLVTGGEDRALRVTHLFSDRAAWELSQGKLGRRAREQGVSRDALRLPPPTQLACTPSRNYQWASVVSVHDCSAKVCGWRFDTRAIAHKIEPIKTVSHTCTAIAVSECGNFAVVGYSSGHVARVNLQDQSLLHFYPTTSDKARVGTSNDRAHPEGAKITAVVVFQWADLVATCAADGVIRTWRLTTGECLVKLALESPVQAVAGHSSSLLLCAGCADYKLRVVALTDGRDIPGAMTTTSSTGANTSTSSSSAQASATVVRTFEGHNAAITAVALSPESLRHLVSAGSDGSLMAWDLAAAQCIAQYRLPSPATSVSFHPDSLFLCTTHAGEAGAFLWTNKLRFGYAPEAVNPSADLSSCPMLHFPKQTADTDAAGAAGDKDGDGEDEEAQEEGAATAAPAAASSPAAATNEAAACDAAGTIHVSGRSIDYWESMAKLDQIRERNEPLLPPKKAAVPFFLPTTSELKPTFIVQEGSSADDAAEREKRRQEAAEARFSHFANASSQTEFGKMLVEQKYDEAIEWMAGATPSLVDLRVRALLKDHEADDETGAIFEFNDKAVALLLQFVEHALRSMRYFDMVQAFVRLLFEVHGETIANHPNAVPLLEHVATAQRGARERYAAAFGRVNCLTATFANAYA